MIKSLELPQSATAASRMRMLISFSAAVAICSFIWLAAGAAIAPTAAHAACAPTVGGGVLGTPGAAGPKAGGTNTCDGLTITCDRGPCPATPPVGVAPAPAAPAPAPVPVAPIPVPPAPDPDPVAIDPGGIVGDPVNAMPADPIAQPAADAVTGGGTAVADAAAKPVVAAQAAAPIRVSTDALPFTGTTTIVPLSILGSMLLLLGSALHVAGRRRRTHAHVTES